MKNWNPTLVGKCSPPPSSKILRTPLQIHELVVEAELRSLTEVMFMITCRGGGGGKTHKMLPQKMGGGVAQVIKKN